MQQKNERKPWYRPRNIALGAAVCLGVVLIYVGWLVYGAVTAVPGNAVDYQRLRAELGETVQPREGENAWPLIERLNGELAALNQEFAPAQADEDWRVDFSVLFDRPPEGETAADSPEELAEYRAHREVARRAVDRARERGLFDLTAAIVAAPRAVRPSADVHLVMELRPELRDVRQTTRLLAARMVEAGNAGDEDEVVRAFEESWALSRHIGRQPSLIDRLVANACAALAVSELQNQLHERAVSAAACRRLLKVIEAEGPFPPLSYTLQAERLMMLDIVQWTHSDDGNGDGIYLVENTAAGSGSSGVAWGNVTGLVLAGKKETTGILDTIFDLNIRASQANRQEAEPLLREAELVGDSLTWRHKIAKVLIRTYENTVRIEHQSFTGLNGVRLTLGIRLFEAENGRLPAAMSELVPGILPALPQDYFAADGEYRYRVLEQPDAHGRRYLVYCIGDDGRDDGGAEPELDVYALNGHAPGTDYVFNRPRSVHRP